MSTLLSPQESALSSSLDLSPVAGHIGAEVRGIRLTPELEQTTLEWITDALHRYKVLFFRGQGHLDDAGQQGFGRLWGELVAHPTVPSREGTQILELDSGHGGRANSWHTDVTFEVAPPKISILRAVTLPAFGGDTVWANTAAAYLELPASLKTHAQGLWAIHGNDYDYGATRVDADPSGVKRHQDIFTRRVIQSEHPVVRVHSETGERSLVLGHFVKRFVGYNSQDSAHLYALYQNHITRLENTVRWHWQVGDIAIWDNQATQHYAINDYGSAKRVVRRVTVAGPIPIGVDGERSRVHAAGS